jgi:SAM-dependent methyltransferase
LPDLLLRVPASFRYVQCTACSTVYQDPRVREEDIALCYPSGYYTRGAGAPWTPTPAPIGGLRDRLRRAIRWAADSEPDPTLSLPLRLAGALLALHPGLRRRARFGLVDGLAPPVGRRRRCLEVGPGHGIDLFCLRTLGWEAQGLEIDPLAAEQARATSGCEVRVGTLASTDYPLSSFDLVYMSHVFEHLPDPLPALARCLELLRPGGRLVLVYPNPHALTARLFGRFSCVFEPPRHLVLPSIRAIVLLARNAGFRWAAARTSARHATTYVSASRAQRAGLAWDWKRPRSPAPGDRLLGWLEGALVVLGLPVGEEVVFRAEKPLGPS